jgi:hypothetical protein
MATFHQLSRFVDRRQRAAMGHEDPFTRPRLNARCRLGEPTFAGMGGKEEDAPIPAAREAETEPRGSTQRGPLECP